MLTEKLEVKELFERALHSMTVIKVLVEERVPQKVV
jgi:hypothetical protein